MNHIFSSIWNHSLGAWVAASEHTRHGRQRGGSASRSRGRQASAPQMVIGALQVAVLLACGWLGGTVVHAADLPTGFSAVSGSATLSQSANNMTISQSGKVSLINWASFDIGTNNTVTFNMPSASSGSINIISGNASTISGSLNSIGNVILVNTNGIVFNNGSAVNVGSLLATSLQPDTSGLSFAAGAELPLSWTFTGSNAPAAIVNRGDINASSGGISLIGGVVENSGNLTAASNASLVVGSKVTSFLMQPSNPTASQPGSWDHMVTASASTGGSWAINNTGVVSGSAIDLKAEVDNGLYTGGINSVGVLQAQGIDGGRLVVGTSASAVLDFGTSSTIGTVSTASSRLGTRGILNANHISLQTTGALELGATLNGSSISLTGSSISQQYDGNEGALKGDVSLQTQGAAMLGSSSNAISHLDGTVGLGLVLASTTDVAQNAALSVGGTTLLNGLAGPSGALAGFTFDRADNSFGNTISGTGGALVLNSSGALNLGTLDVGSLAAQGGAIRLGGNITTSGDIVLQGGLQATGSTAISSTGNGRVEVDGPILASGGVALSGGDIVVGGDITAASVSIDGNTFSGARITSNGALDISVRNGALVQNGAYSAGDTASFAAAGDIVLDNAQNQFGSTVALQGDNVVLDHAGNLHLGYTDAQALQVNTTGSITQAANAGVDVTGTSSFSATGDISLLQAGNRFGGAVSLGGGGGAQINASGDLRFGTLGVSSLRADASTVYLPQSLNTYGAQSYRGRLVLQGDTTLSSTLGALAFTGTLEGPHALSLHASGTVYLDAVANIASLDSVATETQLVADLTTAGDISLANTRVIGDVALTSTAGSVRINGVVNGLQDNTDSLSIAADGQIALRGAVGNAERLHDLSLTAGTVSTVAVDVGNRLAIDSTASINQGGRYGVGGTSRFASGGDITLLNVANTFGGDVELIGNNVQIAAQGPLSLSGVDADLLHATAGGLLTVRNADVVSSTTLTGNAVALDGVALGLSAEVAALGGNITQQGGVRVDGQSRWIAAGNVLLGNDVNQLDGAVTAQGNTVSVTTAGALDVANVQASGQATLRGNGVHLGSLQAMGLEVDSGAGITQGSALTLASASRFTAVDDVLLDNAGNTFGGGVQLVGRNIDIHSAGGLLLNGVDATGNLRATAGGGSLLQSGDVRVQGRSDLLAGGSVQLDRAGNLFTGTVAVEGQSILLRASSGLNMKSVRNGGNGAVQLLAAGDIDVAGDAIDTGSSLLSLLSSAGQVRTATALRGGQVSIGGVEGIRIGGDITATTLSMTSARNDVLQQSGHIQSGNALLSAGQGDLRLTSAANRFTGVTTLHGRDVDVAAGGLLLGDVAVFGKLQLNSSGNIQQQAQMRVDGSADLRANGDITLRHAGNRFTGTVSLQAREATIRAQSPLALEDVNVAQLTADSAGQLSLAHADVSGAAQLDGTSLHLDDSRIGGALTANAHSGDISQGSGALAIGNNSQLQAANVITLDSTQNHFGGRVDLHAASAKLGTNGSLALGDVTADRLQASATQGLQLQGHIAATTVDLATAGAFDNQTGADAIRVGGNGRWHVYLDAPDQGHQFGGLDSGNTAVWNTQALGATSAAGNRYLFAWSPTLTLEGMALSKNLGTVLDISQAYTWSGLMPGVANAYRADSLTEVLGGNIRVTSAGAAGDAAVQSRPYSIELDASHLDLSQSGYQLVLRPGELRITSTQDSAAYQSAIRLPVTAVAEQPLPPTASYVARIAGGMQRPTSRCTALTTTHCAEQ